MSNAKKSFKKEKGVYIRFNINNGKHYIIESATRRRNGGSVKKAWRVSEYDNSKDEKMEFVGFSGTLKSAEIWVDEIDNGSWGSMNNMTKQANQ